MLWSTTFCHEFSNALTFLMSCIVLSFILIGHLSQFVHQLVRERTGHPLSYAVTNTSFPWLKRLLFFFSSSSTYFIAFLTSSISTVVGYVQCIMVRLTDLSVCLINRLRRKNHTIELDCSSLNLISELVIVRLSGICH